MTKCDGCGKPASTIYVVEDAQYVNVAHADSPHYEKRSTGSFRVAVCSRCEESKFKPTGRILNTYNL